MIFNKMNIVCIIPARGGSVGISKKNIIDFCGRPLITWSIKQAKKSRYIKAVYVSSDNEEILQISKNTGAKIIRRPKEIATHISVTEEALWHGIDHIQKYDNKKIDIVVFLQATSPIRTTEDIDSAIELFISKKGDSLFSAAVLEDFCIWDCKDGKLESLSYDYKNRGRRQDRRPLYLENGSIYIFKPIILKKNNRRLGGKIVTFLMDYWKSYEIDKIEDVEICEYFMKTKILEKM